MIDDNADLAVFMALYPSQSLNNAVKHSTISAIAGLRVALLPIKQKTSQSFNYDLYCFNVLGRQDESKMFWAEVERLACFKLSLIRGKLVVLISDEGDARYLGCLATEEGPCLASG